jgi:arylsulfatase A-like enzyme
MADLLSRLKTVFPSLAVRFGLGWVPFLTGLFLLAGCAPTLPSDADDQPNLVIIFADDLGYGDVGVYGHPTIHTPHLDRMAAQGMRFTQFYTAASVCTPSRAALLTGRLPVRSGMASDGRRVLFPDSKLGLPSDEITLAEVLKEQGYATAAIGKWHLGHLPPYLPTRHGFDLYYGIPYSNDMDRVVGGEWQEVFWEPKVEYWNVPLMRGEEIIERPADQRTITKRYTEEAVRFIRTHKDEPFFVYLAHSMPHVPLFRSDAFAGASRRGLYGDVIEEIDWSVGQVLDALREEGLAERTLVFFTSDNGPWLVFDTHGGSAGLLHGGKGMTWEGGMRVPGLAWWPGTIAPNSVNAAVTSTMDLFPTALAMTGRALPGDRAIDGRDLLPMLTGASPEPVRDVYFYYRGATLYAARKGPWKAHFITEWAYLPDNQRTEHDPPRLFHLERDPSEQYDVAAEHPEVIADILNEVERHRADLEPGPSQLDARIDDP